MISLVKKKDKVYPKITTIITLNIMIMNIRNSKKIKNSRIKNKIKFMNSSHKMKNSKKKTCKINKRLIKNRINKTL